MGTRIYLVHFFPYSRYGGFDKAGIAALQQGIRTAQEERAAQAALL
jgi:hypothetical protein